MSSGAIDIGQITEALKDKVDLPGSKNQSDIRVVVEVYSNGSSWYRVYSDGWCEQGGDTTGAADALITVYFMKQYKSAPEVLTTRKLPNIVLDWVLNQRYDAVQDITTSSFKCWGIFSSGPLQWRASGYVN